MIQAVTLHHIINRKYPKYQPYLSDMEEIKHKFDCDDDNNNNNTPVIVIINRISFRAIHGRSDHCLERRGIFGI